MPVAFDEIAGESPKFSGTKESISGTRAGFIAWGSIDTLFQELFPPAVASVPQLPALMPGSSFLRAKQVDFEPWHDDGQNYGSCGTSTLMTYEKAKVTISYESLPLSQEGDNILTRRHSLSNEIMTLPNTGLKWDGDANHIQNPELQADKNIPMEEISLQFHYVESVDWATVRGLIGKINDDTFEGWPAESLLFAGAEVQQTFSSDGTSTLEVEFRFVGRLVKDGAQEVGWNFFFDPHPDQGKFRRLKTKDDQDIFEQGDFDTLL